MILLFDIGRTKTRATLFAGGESWEGEPEIFDTPKTAQECLEEIIRLLKTRDIEMAVGGISRAVWPAEDVESVFAKTLDCQIVINNDSAVVGLGEAVYGAGRGYNTVSYLTVSSGVGGARVVEGGIDKSSFGFEPGHQVLKLEDGELKTLENLISGRSLEANYGCKPYEIEIDDPVWDKLAEYLAWGVNNTAVYWSSEVIVVGGSMMKVPGIDINTVKDKLKPILKVYDKLPEVKLAELGDFGGLYGALVIAKAKR